MTGNQHIRAVLYGIVFWFVAAMTIHLFPALFDGATLNAIVLAVSVPIAWASVPVSRMAAKVGAAHVLEANVVAVIAAAMADGAAITFASDALYAGVTPASQFGAAWILWGVGWILLFAWRAGRSG